MILNFLKGLCCFVLILALVACNAATMQSPAKLADKSQDIFMDAMRWKNFEAAANLMLPEHRKDFKKTFRAVKDITIVDVTLVDVQASDEDRHFETTVEMEYYLLPSVTLKTFSFDQTWLYFDGEDPTQQGFLITTPFPEFP